VTPSEHLTLPDTDDVKQGVIASRIAAHAADIARGTASIDDWDTKMAVARKKLDWETQVQLSLDPDYARAVHKRFKSDGTACSMCGGYCAMELVSKYLGVETRRC